jgi:long-chain acyl-CoA synthetase
VFQGTLVVGFPMPGNSVRLKSCLGRDGEALVLDHRGLPYLSVDTKHHNKACFGRGEVLIRGNSVSPGYYVGESLTRSNFDKEGWFHTGDVGVWTCPGGDLQIVDRLENLVKLKGGEYVALENMEEIFNQSAFVNARNGGVMCYADAGMDLPIALVQVFVFFLLCFRRFPTSVH